MDMYVITNGKNYLGDVGKTLSAVSQKDKARLFTLDKGKNTLANLPKSLKNLGYQLVLCEEKSLSPKTVINLTDNVYEDILKKVEDFENYIKEIENNKVNLALELSKVDGEIQDILHAAEFFNLSASEGYKLYKMLHEKRVKRRKIKDYIEIVRYIEETNGKEFSENKGSKSIKGKLTRDYKPKVLKELFNR